MTDEQLNVWVDAIDAVLHAAEDTAEFAPGKPIGRSREASIRKLAAALDRLKELERALGVGGGADATDLLEHAQQSAVTPG